MHLDSLVSLLFISAIVLLFTVSVFHKLAAPRHFIAVVTDYQLTPENFALPAGIIMIGAECAIIVLALAGARDTAAAIAAALLGLYAIAIGINLLRNRRDIDCGCTGPAASQTLSGWLVTRNLGLMILALIALLPATVRPFTLADWATLIVGLGALCGLYIALNTLIANHLLLNSKRENRLWKTR